MLCHIRISDTKLTSTLSHQERTQQQTHSADRKNPLRSVRVKHRPNLHSAEEAQKHIDREDPSDGLLAIARELVVAEIGMEDSNRIHISEASSHAAEGAEDHEPGPQAALGVLDVVLILCSGATIAGVVAEGPFFIFGRIGLGTGGTRLEWRA